MQHCAAGGILPLYDTKAKFATVLVGLRPLLAKPLVTPLFVLERRVGDDAGEDPTYLAVVPYTLRKLNLSCCPSQCEESQSTDEETTLAAESNDEVNSCGAGVEFKPGIGYDEGLCISSQVTVDQQDDNGILDSLDTVTQDRLPHGDHEEGCDVALPKYDQREPEPVLTWHHSGMYLNRERPETKLSLPMPSLLPPDTTAICLPGMRTRLLVKHVSLVVEIPATMHDVVTSASPSVNLGPIPPNEVPAGMQVTDATFGDAWAESSRLRSPSPLPASRATPPIPRQVPSRRELNPLAQEFVMSSSGPGFYTSPQLRVGNKASPHLPNQQDQICTNDFASEQPYMHAFMPSPEGGAFRPLHLNAQSHEQLSPCSTDDTSSLLAILNGQGSSTYDPPPIPLLPAISLSPRAPLSSPSAYNPRNDYQEFLRSTFSDSSPSPPAVYNGPLIDTSYDRSHIPFAPVDRISSPDDPPLIRRTPVGTRTPPRKPWYARPQLSSTEVAPPWPPFLSGRELTFSPSP